MEMQAFDNALFKHLSDHLKSLAASDTTTYLSFHKIEELIGAKLPIEAIEGKWWHNRRGNSRAKYWLDAGFSTYDFNKVYTLRNVYFKRHEDIEATKSKVPFVGFYNDLKNSKRKGHLRAVAILGLAGLLMMTIAAFTGLAMLRNRDTANIAAILEQWDYRFLERLEAEILESDISLDDLEDADDALNNVITLTKLLEYDFPTAQFVLGVFYLYGGNIPYIDDIDSLYMTLDDEIIRLVVDIEPIYNFELAEKWLLMAAESGYTSAKFFLGRLYFLGLQGDYDFIQAEKWFRKAAMENHVQSMIHLSQLYHAGRGNVQQSYGDSIYWIRKSIYLGGTAGKLIYGSFYFRGLGVNQCFETAAYWISQAASLGDIEAMNWFSAMNLQGIFQQYDKRFGYELLRKIAENGDAEAQHNMGLLYHNGIFVSQCYNTAIDWFRKSADQQFVMSYFMIGYHYQNSLGIPFRCPITAMEWYARMRVDGNDFAQNIAYLALMMMSDEEVAIDYYEYVLVHLESFFVAYNAISVIQTKRTLTLFYQQFAQILDNHFYPLFKMLFHD